VTADRLRLCVDEPAPAAWNMAVDEALLLRATLPTLRLYGFCPHAVSLGYFQRAADFADLPADTPIVRRLTGGGAIWHGDEITFALVLDADLLPGDVAGSYRLLHDACRRALAATGVDCARQQGGDAQRARPAQRWCFAAPGQDDLVTAHGKLLGSAQRRIRQPRPRVLHHGSLVVRRPAATPFVAAVADAREPSPVLLARLRAALAAEFAAALGLPLAPGGLDAEERALATALQARYAGAFLHVR
jgi:lipoate-protein ligase A